MKLSAWKSVTAFASEYGYHTSTVRRWVKELLSEPKLDAQTKAGIIIGKGRALRVHTKLFCAWLEARRQTPKQIVVVHVINQLQ